MTLLDYLRALRHGSSAYWERRARKYGTRSVLHLRHTAAEVEQVTAWQKSMLFPLLQAQLRGDERTVLDFGCGPGRFTPGLAELTRAHVMGVDPIETLLELAPQAPNVEYRLLKRGNIPIEDHSIDVLWIVLVIGLIRGRALRHALQELQRVLAPGGLVFLVENTSNKKPLKQIEFRSVADYQALFGFADLKHLYDYQDLGETISVLSGRTK